jgi:hypothetical protein
MKSLSFGIAVSKRSAIVAGERGICEDRSQEVWTLRDAIGCCNSNATTNAS